MSDHANEYRARPDADRIPCPFLLSAYNNGDLVPEDDGTVQREVIDAALSSVGLGEGVRSRLVKLVLTADAAPTSLNLFRLRDSAIDHTGSTGIRDPEVDPAKLPELLAFGEKGRMYKKHFARAASHFGREDPGLAGTMVQTVEMTALLEIFGRVDEAGRRYLTDEDIAGLWLHGRYPDGWKPRPKDSIRVVGFLWSSGKTGAWRVIGRLRRLLPGST